MVGGWGLGFGVWFLEVVCSRGGFCVVFFFLLFFEDGFGGRGRGGERELILRGFLSSGVYYVKKKLGLRDEFEEHPHFSITPF